MRLLLGVAACILCCAATAHAADGLAAEARRRNDELVHQGFNFTHGLTFGAAGDRLEFAVPPDDEEHIVSLWFAAPAGELSVRLLGPARELLASWKAQSGEQRLVRKLPGGSYAVEVGGAAGRGLVGIKGSAVSRCAIDGARLHEHAADPARGFHWPYLLVAPASRSAGALLVLPNNGLVTEELDLLRASATCQLAHDLAMADRLGVALLIPLFPRPRVAGEAEDLYLHALTRAALQTKEPRYARVDLQLIAMIDQARESLGRAVPPRVLISGFSDAGMFANRFAVLHPERVLAAAIGSPGGWPIAPVADPALTYPVGMADVASLTGASVDRAALANVRFHFFLGADDANDSVPCRDSYSKSDEALIMRRFGPTPVARWEAARRLYDKAALHASFTLYPGVAHTTSPQMQADLEAFFKSALQ